MIRSILKIPDRKKIIAAGFVLGSFLLQSLLTLTLFPAARQFFKYPHAARQYLEHTLPPERLLDLSPFYFYLHLAQNALFPGGETVIQLLQILLAGLSIGLLFLILCRFFPLALAAAGTTAFALSRSVAEYAAIFEPEIFLLFFLLGFVHCCLREGRGSRLAAGIFFALCLIIRPNFLPLLLLVPIFFRLQDGPGKWLSSSALFLAPALVAILFLGGRNYYQTGVPSPLVMNPGYIFFEGNNPISSGQSSAYPPLVGELKLEIPGQPDNPHVSYRLLARRTSGIALSVAEVNAYWTRKALNFIVDHPSRFLRQMGTKGYFLFHDFRRFDVPAAYLYDRILQQKWIPTIPFALVSALSLAGLVAAGRNWRRHFLFYAIFASQAGLMLVMYVSDRQRLILLPFFIFFACAGAGFLWTRKRFGLMLAPVLLIIAAGLYRPSEIMRDDLYLWERYERSDHLWLEAVRERDAGNHAEAARIAARSLAAASWLADYSRPAYLPFEGGIAATAIEALKSEGEHTSSNSFDHAVLLLQAGRLDAAEKIMRELAAAGRRFDRVYLQSSQPFHYLARIAALRGDHAQAVSLAEQALALSPGDPFTLAQLAALTGRDEYRLRLVRYFGEADAAFLFGRSCLENGRAEKAAESLSYTVRIIPELRRARIYLAAALGSAGEHERAAEVYMEATRERSDPVLLEQQILATFGKLAEKYPGNAMVRHNFAKVLALYGYFARALAEERIAFSLSPNPDSEKSIRWLEGIVRGLGDYGIRIPGT